MQPFNFDSHRPSGQAKPCLTLEEIKVGESYNPSFGTHPRFPHLHTIQGLRKYAKEEKKLRSVIAAWQNRTVWKCVGFEGIDNHMVTLEDHNNERFATYPFFLVSAN